MRPLATHFLSLIVLIQLTGCASVTRGTTDVLEVHTDPGNAEVLVYRTDQEFTKYELKKNFTRTEVDEIEDDNKLKSDQDKFAGPIRRTTPAIFSLARKGKFKVVVTKSGYEMQEIIIDHEVAGTGAAGMAGNVLLGGVLGAAIDAGSGAMFNLIPNPVEVSLVPEVQEDAAAAATVEEVQSEEFVPVSALSGEDDRDNSKLDTE